MKQVTMESVKQRIAHIEDLNARGVGTKVQQQQFELSCLRELVAVTEQRDASISAERTWETTMMDTCGEDGPASVAAEFKALREQRDAVVVENVALKNVFIQKEIPSEAVDAFMETAVMDHDWDETSEWSWVENETEVIHAVLDVLKPETPTTDAAIAALRAEGIHFTANRLLAAYDHGFINKPAKEVADVARMIITAIDELPTATPEDLTDSYSKQSLAEIARQLRESKGEVQS